jgi:hypothetical protein
LQDKHDVSGYGNRRLPGAMGKGRTRTLLEAVRHTRSAALTEPGEGDSTVMCSYGGPRLATVTLLKRRAGSRQPPLSPITKPLWGEAGPAGGPFCTAEISPAITVYTIEGGEHG